MNTKHLAFIVMALALVGTVAALDISNEGYTEYAQTLRNGHTITNTQQATGENFSITTTNGLNYTIDNIALRIKATSANAGQTVRVTIYPANASGLPNGAAVGFAQVAETGFPTACSGARTTFDFSPDLSLSSGVAYQFVTSYSGTSAEVVRSCYNATGTYAPGNATLKVDGGGWTPVVPGPSTDFDFVITYNETVVPPATSNFSITANDNFTGNPLTTFNATIYKLTPDSVTNSTSGNTGLLYQNYTVDTTVPITWQVKHGEDIFPDPTYNVTIPTACTANPLQLRWNSRQIAFPTSSTSFGQCWNGTAWQTITTTYVATSSTSASATDNYEVAYDGNFTTCTYWQPSINQWTATTTSICNGRPGSIYEGWVIQEYNTTTGTIFTNLNQTLGNNYNITVSAQNYLPAHYSNWNTSVNLTASLAPYTQVRVINQYTNGSVSGATVTYAGENYTTNSTGHALLPVSTGTYAISVSATNYLSRDFSGLIQGANSTVSIFQAQVTFTAQNLVTGAAVTGFTVTTTNASNNTTPATLYLDAGTYTFTFTHPTYYPTTLTRTVGAATNTSSIFEAFDAKLQATAFDNQTGAAITTFSVRAEFGNVSQTAYTTNGTATINWTNATPTSLTLIAPGYTPSTVSVSVPTTGVHNYTLYAFPLNSVNINIYDQNTLVLLNGTAVQITISSLNFTQTNVTTTGTFFTILPPGEYSFTFNATGYGTAIVSATVDNNTQVLNAYLVNGGATVEFTTLDDLTGLPIQGALWTIQRVIGTNFTTVASLFSDISGQIEFTYVPLIQYRFIVTKSGYENLTFLLNPIIQPAYTVRLSPTDQFNSSQDYSKISLIVNPNIFYNEQINVLTMVILSPYGTLLDYNITATYPIASGVYNTSTANGSAPNGSTLIIPFNISTSAVLDTVNITYGYRSSVSGVHNFRFVYAIQNVTVTPGLLTNIGADYGMGAFERILIVTFMAFGIAALVGTFVNPIAGGVMALFIFGLFTASGFISWWATGISLIAGFMLVAWASGR